MAELKYDDTLDGLLPFSGKSADRQDRYQAAYTTWAADRSPRATGELLTTVKPTIDAAVRTYASNTSPAVASRAKLYTTQAFETFDPSRGTLHNHLLAQLRRLSRDGVQSQQAIHFPERLLADRKYLQEAEEAFREQWGRSPSNAELSKKTGFSSRRLSHIRRVQVPLTSGRLRDASGSPFSPAVSLIGDNSTQTAWEDFLYDDLSAVDQAIVDHTLGRHGAAVWDNRTLAANLGLSPGAVSQRKAKIQAMFDRPPFLEGP